MSKPLLLVNIVIILTAIGILWNPTPSILPPQKSIPHSCLSIEVQKTITGGISKVISLQCLLINHNIA
jgi:hypothetical protein